MKPARSALAAALLAALAAAAGAGEGEGAPDFQAGRAADPDFNLSFELTGAKGQPLLVAVGSQAGYAFARLAPGG